MTTGKDGNGTMQRADAPDGARPYHHGNLREALLVAAEAVLAEAGTAGFSLRATARRAAVSHAAPAHHFGDVDGLLGALCERGFRRLTETMTAYLRDERTPVERLLRAGAGYVAFARAHPALFELMFGARMAREGGPSRGNAAFALLLDALGAARGRPIGTDDDWRAVAGTWAVVHGLAQLAIAGQLHFLPRARDAAGESGGTLGDEEIVRVLRETLADTRTRTKPR